VGHLLRYVFEPGFFTSGPVHVAFAVGTVIAITSAVVGVFTVSRRAGWTWRSCSSWPWPPA
jgi:zinc/manganese transport system permease protein